MNNLNQNVQNGTKTDLDTEVSISDLEQGLGQLCVFETEDGIEIRHHITARERFCSEYSKFAVKTAQSTVEMCRVVFEAKKSLEKSVYQHFLKDIGHSSEDSTIRKYLAIGERYNDLIAYTNLLPSSWTSIYVITQIPSESFMAMVAMGESMANLTGAQIKMLKGISASDKDKTVDSTVNTMTSTNVKKSPSLDKNESEQSIDRDSASVVVKSTDSLIAAQATASATSDAISADDVEADSSSDNEFAQQATSSLLERVSQNTNATTNISLCNEEEVDEPYEVFIRFKSRPSTEATQAIVEALTSVFSKHRVEAAISTTQAEII
jgi:hypothetical protein